MNHLTAQKETYISGINYYCAITFVWDAEILADTLTCTSFVCLFFHTVMQRLVQLAVPFGVLHKLLKKNDTFQKTLGAPTQRLGRVQTLLTAVAHLGQWLMQRRHSCTHIYCWVFKSIWGDKKRAMFDKWLEFKKTKTPIKEANKCTALPSHSATNYKGSYCLLTHAPAFISLQVWQKNF